MQMSEASQLADDIRDLDLAGSASDSAQALSLAMNEATAHEVTLEETKAALDMARAQAEAEIAEKTLAYEKALAQIESQKAEKSKKVKRKTSHVPETNSYKKPKLRKADGSGSDIRYRPTVNEKIQILQFRHGTASTKGHTVRETLAKFDKVEHSQLKRWKKKSVLIGPKPCH